MSRIGKKPIELPDKVKVNVGQGGKVQVEGPKGKLEYTLPEPIKASVEGKIVTLSRASGLVVPYGPLLVP